MWHPLLDDARSSGRIINNILTKSHIFFYWYLIVDVDVVSETIGKSVDQRFCMKPIGWRRLASRDWPQRSSTTWPVNIIAFSSAGSLRKAAIKRPGLSIWLISFPFRFVPLLLWLFDNQRFLPGLMQDKPQIPSHRHFLRGLRQSSSARHFRKHVRPFKRRKTKGDKHTQFPKIEIKIQDGIQTWAWARSSSRGQESEGTLRGFLKDFLSEIMWCCTGRMLPVHGRIKTSSPSSSSASSLPTTDGLSAYRNKISLVISLSYFMHTFLLPSQPMIYLFIFLNLLFLFSGNSI